MAKSRERDPDQLQLRVFTRLDGGLLRADMSRQEAHSAIQSNDTREPRLANAEDRAIYDAIVERYFSSDR